MKVIFSFLILLLLSCTEINTIESAKQELIETDKNFSKLSVEKGKNYAFLQYIDSEGVILKANSMPVEGKNRVSKMYENEPDSGYTLEWKPLNATISKSTDLGYTYGIWKYDNNDTLIWGTYVTIWKKNENGIWKFVLDSGNLGLGKNAEKVKEQF